MIFFMSGERNRYFLHEWRAKVRSVSDCSLILTFAVAKGLVTSCNETELDLLIPGI